MLSNFLNHAVYLIYVTKYSLHFLKKSVGMKNKTFLFTSNTHLYVHQTNGKYTQVYSIIFDFLGKEVKVLYMKQNTVDGIKI